MTESSPDIRPKDQNIGPNQDNGRIRKAPTEESLNTKNFIKKMTAKKADQDERAQQKITAYMNFSNSTSLGLKQGEQNNHHDSAQDQRVRQLQERLKQRDLQIQKMKRIKEIDENRYSNLFMESKDFKRKSREATARSMLEAAQYRRAQRSQIDPKIGYFKDGGRTFVDGTLLTHLKQKIKEKLKIIKELQDDKKSRDQQKKQRAQFMAQFHQKEVNSLQKQLDSMQSSTNLYKERLKIAEKQANCEYAQKGWPIVYEQYQTLQLLGKGGFGEVYKCFDLENNLIVALKVNVFTGDAQNQEQLYIHVQREAEAIKKFHHANIGKFLKLVQCSGNRIVFALQYCMGPELSQYLKRYICLEEKQAKQIIRQIFSALNYLSNLKERIIHYDLKPSNIMFHHGIIKILDFGLCKPMDGEESKIALTSQGVGTYWYLPPETFEEHLPHITPKVDVWSTGVIFYELLYGKRPFGHGISQEKIYNQGIILKNAKKLQFPAQTPKKYKVSESAKNFIKQCLAYNQEQRLTASEAYDHQYFKK